MKSFALFTSLLIACSVHARAEVTLRLIGEQVIPSGTVVTTNGAATTLGGLSGIDYDPKTNSFYAISDDRSQINPARFYNLSLDFDLCSFRSVTINATVFLKQPNGENFPPLAVDPESIRFNLKTAQLAWTSEGSDVSEPPQNAFVRIMKTNGSHVSEFALPEKFRATGPLGKTGIRNNLAFEGAAYSRDFATLYIAMENALKQDGPVASISEESPSRVIALDATTGAVLHEWIYPVSPIPKPPVPPGSPADNGLAEILVLGPDVLLALERSYSTGVGNTIRLFAVKLTGATDVSKLEKLSDAGAYVPLSKNLVADLQADFGVKPDNLEGITFGPNLSGGHRSMVFVSDNNSSETQKTQFLVFEVIP